MRLDLIPERDRFIPGWHSQPDTQRPEFTSPEWQWPSRLRRAVWTLLSRKVPDRRMSEMGSNSAVGSYAEHATKGLLS